jgi:hypothetical protein
MAWQNNHPRTGSVTLKPCHGPQGTTSEDQAHATDEQGAINQQYAIMEQVHH